MAINFCHEELGSKIICSQVATENYEVENLISGNVASKNRGFLAGSFVRPPVDIIVQFPCPVKICCVVVNGKVGNQQSTNLELFSQSEPPGAFNPFNYGAFHQVQKFNWDTNYSGSHFTSTNHGTACRSSENQNYSRCNLSQRSSAAVSSVWSLRIRILRTSGSSVPAVASLQIWGYISPSCTGEMARSILRKWQDLNQPQMTIRDTTVEKSQEIQTIFEEEGFSVPDEFLDGLTCEIMALPVRLPSGNVVDERTLERFVETEASWGRSASDPFTGQLFNSLQKPLYDTALKARIDAFLMEHSHQKCLRDVPRTIGPIKRPADALLINGLTGSNNKRSCQVVPQTQASQPTSPLPSSSTDPSRRWLRNLASNLHSLSRSTTRNATVVPVKTESDSAGQSSCSCGHRDILYSLPCSHRICRNCLLSLKQQNRLQCLTCEGKFENHEPVRLHILHTVR